MSRLTYGLRHALLGLLADRPHSGWQLLKHFEGSLAYAWPALHSQIYPELARLRDGGSDRADRLGRARREGVLAHRGRHGGGRRWLRETAPGRGGRDDALLRVFFLWLLEPDEAAGHLAVRRTTCGACSPSSRPSPPSTVLADAKDGRYRLALDYGLRVTRRAGAWAEDAAREVRERTASLPGAGDRSRSSSCRRRSRRAWRNGPRSQGAAAALGTWRLFRPPSRR